MKTYHKILSILVVAAILLGMLPMDVFAEGEEEETDAAYAPALDIDDTGKIRIYANGTPILIKENNGHTYVYDITGQKKLFENPIEDIAGVFGGTKYAETVGSTKVVMESGTINTQIYGGGNKGNVKGLSEVIIKGGFCNNIYGGSAYGTVGSVRVESNGRSAARQNQIYGGGYQCTVFGDVDIVLNNIYARAVVGGTSSSGNIKGNVNFIINDSTIAVLYGGCVAANGYIEGSVCFNISGTTNIQGIPKETTYFQPLGKDLSIPGGARVNGGASVYVPKSFDITKMQTNNSISVFQGGVQVSGPAVTKDDKGNIFANGITVVVKLNPEDGRTYIYDSRKMGKLLPTPVDGLAIFGGDAGGTVAGAKVTMESGNVAAIYGGGLNGTVAGSSFVTIHSGVAESVYAGGLNGSVNAIGHIKIGEGATVTQSVYANRIDRANESVVWVNKDFDRTKIKKGENVRIFVDSAELPDTSVVVPKGVYRKNNYVFANGISILIKKDDRDGRTYIYDEAGTTKLLADEVNGLEIYGGSLNGVVGSTNVTLESGTVTRIYGGGYTSCVTGTAKITITGGDVTEVIYGGSYDGDVGAADIYVGGPYVAKVINAGSRNGSVLGDTKVIVKDCGTKVLYAGTGGDEKPGRPSSDVLGNASLTVDGGILEKIYGGGKSGVVRGRSTITIQGQVAVKTFVNPQSNGGVTGGATVYVPANFAYMDTIATGAGINIIKTEMAVPTPTPKITVQTEKVMSTAADSGKLVFQFVNIKEPNGKLTGRPGEAYFITFPNGSTMLVDAGGNTDSSEAVLCNFLDQLNVKKIDYVVASHYHADHIGRMTSILNKYTVGRVYTTRYDVPLTGEYYTSLKAWLAANPNKSFNLWRGDKLTIDGVEVEILNPVNDPAEIARMSGNGLVEEDYNNNSIVMKMTYGNNTALLTGDLYIGAEAKLRAAYGADQLKADLLKVPHHGDTTSSDPEFVAAVSPKVAVITHFIDTAIVNNRYKSVGADTYVTGEDGIVKVVLNGNDIPEVTTEYYVARPTLEVAGGTEVIYVDSTTETATGYTYAVYDQYGKAMDGMQVTCTLTDDHGNWINDPAITFAKDTLNVKGKPKVPYVVLNFLCGDSKVSKRTVFTEVPLSEYTVAIEGPDTLDVTLLHGATAAYTPVVKNRKGEKVEGIPVELKLTDYAGLRASFKEAENKLEVSEESSSGILRWSAMFKGTTGVVAEKSVHVKAVPTLTIAPREVSVRYTDPSFTVKLTSENYTEEIVAGLQSGKLVSGMDSYLYKDGTKLPLILDRATGEFSVTKRDAALSSSDIGTYSAYLAFPELNVKGTFTVVIQEKKSTSSTAAPVTVNPTPTPAPTPASTATPTSTSTPAEPKPENTAAPTVRDSFTDVRNHWAEKYIHALTAKNIINGKRENGYDPEGKMTRAEFSSILARVLALPEDAEVTFTDVEADAWYAKYINAAYAAGLISGNGDGTFAPEAFISREEMAVITFRAYRFAKGMAVLSNAETGTAFEDANAISDWAVKDVAALYSLGLIKGSNGIFMPKEDMTRAEGAVIVYNLLVKLGVL